MKVGILGAGQLGQMLALAGYPLGLDFVFYDRDPNACAGRVGKVVLGEFGDYEKLTAFAQQVDIVTVEFENVPLSALKHVEQYVPVFPNPDAIKKAQDRLVEKQLFHSLGIPTPIFNAIYDVEALTAFATAQQDSLMLKSRQFGYDGKGQFVLHSPDQAEQAWMELGGVPLIAEEYVSFAREVSIVAVRSQEADIRFYPLTENLHKQGILRVSRPIINDDLQSAAEQYIQMVMEKLEYVGVLAFEFFVCGDSLLANEIAPRVHNSAHWTIEGAISSQFENHLRAVLNWPLGDTSLEGDVVMYNLIGEHPELSALLNISDLHVHLYGKEARSGRKVGHVTVCGEGVKYASMLERVLRGFS